MNTSSLHRLLAVGLLAFLPARLVAATPFYIEAEDFDYDGGRHRSEADVMPYYGGAYASRGAQAGVDFYRNNDESSGDVYRSGEDPNVPMFEINALSNPELMSRGEWTMNVNHRLGWMSRAYGVWMNYTRVFPAGRYQVCAAMTYGDSTPNAIKASLSRVTSGAGTADQTLEALGEFLGDGSGSWDRNTTVPLRTNGVAAVLDLSGLTTLRFTAGEGDFDYLVFRPEGAPDVTVTPLLNVDFCAHLNWSFTNKVGPAAVGQGPNDFWNLYSRDDGQGGFLPSGTMSDLKWADGTVSSVDLAVANAPGMWHSGSADPMMQSYLYPFNSGDIVVTLTEVPAGAYELYFYAHGVGDSENGVVQVTCGGVDYGTKSTTTSAGWNTTEWQEGQQYVRFENLAVSGQALVITVKPGSTGLAVMNGMQLLARSAPPPPFNLATNGSFELPPGIVTYRVFNTGTELPGWIVEQGTVEIVGPYWQAAEGLQSLDLNGTFEDIGTISHPLSTMPGQRYKVRFAYAGNPEGGPAIKTTKVFWNDTLLAEVSFDTTGRSLADMGWVYYEYEVTASSTTSQLKFQSTTPTFCGPALDDVSVTIMDEPPPPPQCAAAPAGLVAWWRGEGDLQDAVGGHHGALFNGAAPAAGQVGQGLTFDGADDYATIPFSPEMASSTFSVETWIKPLGSVNDPMFGQEFIFGQALGSPALLARPGAGGIRVALAIAVNWAAGFYPAAEAAAELPFDEFSHVAGTWDGTTLRVYVNGVLSGEYAPGSAPTPATCDFFIGGHIGSCYGVGFSGGHFNGVVDELSLYNRPLTTQEIQSVFAAGATGKCPLTPPPPCVASPDGLVAWWRGEGDPLDAVGGHHGSAAAGVEYAAGQVGQAFRFNGGDQVVRVPSSAGLDIGTGEGLTIEAWIKPDHATAIGPLVEWNDPGTSRIGSHLWINVDYPPGSVHSLFANLLDTQGSMHIIDTGVGLLTPGSWHHVAMTYDKSSGGAVLYLDGAVVETRNLGTFTPATSYDLWFGRRVSGDAFLWSYQGLLDEVGLYRRSLSPSEIQAVYAAGSHGKCPPAPLPFNDGIPDSWREQHFGPGFATDSRAPATADPDGDGANNYREFLDGTDPLAAASVKRVPLWVSTYAGSTRGAQDGFRTEARFNYLPGFAFDSAGRLWIPELSGSGYDLPGDGFQRIRLLDASGMVSVLTGAEAGLVEGPLDQARFSGPMGVVFDSHGNAFVLDMFNHRIRKIDSSGVVSTFAGSTRGYRDGPALQAQFDVPHGIAIDAHDNLFIADWFNLRIRKITPQGDVSTFSGSSRGAQDGPRLQATYDGPVDLVITPTGVMYVSDWANGRIRKIDTNGDVSTFVSGLSYTEMLSLGSDGAVYCYAAGLRQFNKYGPDGSLLWSWSTPEGSADGPIGIARFGMRLTKGIEVTDGNLLVADEARIRLITMGVAPLVTIAPPGGPFASQVEVTLTTEVPNGVIRFTTDGAEPTTASPAYATPILLTASTTVKARVFVNGNPVSDVATAEFTRLPDDEQDPVVTITSPVPGPTENELVQLSGTVTDNVGVVAAWLVRDGLPPTPLALNGGQILSPALRLHEGENRLRVVATDAAGNEGAAEVLVTWAPARVLFVENPEERQEGLKVRVPIKLTSRGGVGGLTFVLRYNPDYLRPLNFEWFTESDSAYRVVNLDVAGEVRATLALTDAAVPAGTHRVGTMVFRARSVPATLTTELPLELVDIADVRGDRIGFGNAARSGVAQIRVRRVVGDNNANQRLDTGDATAIQRLLALLDPVREWDRGGNDVNQNADLDSGDVVRVLRAVVRLDPQPAPAKAGSAAGTSDKEGPVTVGATALSADRLRGEPGDRVTIRVELREVPVLVSGAAFTLEYPTNALRLLDRQSHRVGPLAAGRALALWNVAPPLNDYRTQPGRAVLGLSGASAWPNADGVLAEFTFEVQPGQSARYCWPVRLSGVEVTSENGLEVFRLPDAEIRFIGRDPIRPNLELPTLDASGGGVQLRLTGEADVAYVVEASSNLRDWTPVGTVQSPDGSLSFSDATSAGAGHRFYRLRQQ